MLRFKDLMERVNETRSFYLEEVEELDENFDSNSKAHQAAKEAVKGFKAKHSKATYHPDGTATITTNGRLADDPSNKHDISKQVDMKSHHVVNAHLKSAGGTHGMTADETNGHKEKLNGVNWKVKEKTKPSLYKAGSHEIHLSEEVEGLDYDLFESIMLGEGDLSIRTLYNKYADHALGAGDKPEPKKAAAVKKAITKVHGSTVMGHLEKAKNAAAKNDQESESHHFNAARNSAKTDTMGATVGKGRSSMRKEDVNLDESRMKDLAMDMESLSHADFKKKHKRTKQEMQSSLKSEGISLDELSVDTMRSYRAKAKDDAYDAADVDDDRRLRKRSMGSWDAGKKILKKGAPLRKEEIEQTDEELKGNQHKIDANKNGKVDGHDFKILRNAKKARYQ